MKDKWPEIDGIKIIEEYLLTKGEQIVVNDQILFKPIIDFGLIVYGLKVNATNRTAMQFDLERFFMRRCMGELSGTETKFINVGKDTFEKVKKINDQYRKQS